MGLIFHDGTNAVYKAYTQSRAWNNMALLWNPPQYLNVYNTEDFIKAILKNPSSKLTYRTTETVSTLKGRAVVKVKQTTTVDLEQFIDAPGEGVNLWVIKGLHQPNDPHITCGHEGKLWHLNLTKAGDRVWVSGMTAGEQVSAVDADGFQAASGKKGRRR